MNNWIIALILLNGGYAWAAEKKDAPYSSVVLELGSDSTGGALGSLSGNISFPNRDFLSLQFASNRAKDRTTGETAMTKSFYGAYTINPYEKWTFVPGVEVWSAGTDLTTRSLMVEVARNLEEWTFGLQPEFKSLMWQTTLAHRRNVKTSAFGLHLHADYLGVEDWFFALRAGGFNYGGERFDDFLDSYVVSDSAYAQSSGLVKNYGGLSVRFHPSEWTFGINTQRSTYLVAGVRTFSVSADVQYDISRAWQVGYGFTTSKPDNSGSTQASALSAGYNW